MTTEVVPSNEFQVVFEEDKSLVTINFQGLQKSRLDALEFQVSELEDDLAEAIIEAGGDTSTVATDLAALTGVVSALAVDVAAEPPIRSAADVATNLAIVALSDSTDAAIAAEAATRLAADTAEVVARDAAIAAAVAPYDADIAALEAADISLTAAIGAVETSQTAVLVDVAALDTAFDALSAEFATWTGDFTDVEDAVTDEMTARAAADVAMQAEIDAAEGALAAHLADVTDVHDHGSLAGLGDDDHTQYHNDTRGDARYSVLAHTHWVSVPASAGASGTAGQMAYASGFLYVCVATNTWERAVLASW